MNELGILPILLFLLLVAGAVVEIMLFIKVWRMTDDVRNIAYTITTGDNGDVLSRDSALAAYVCGNKQAALKALCFETCCTILNRMSDYETDKAFPSTRDEVLKQAEPRFAALGTEIPSELRNLTFSQINLLRNI